FAFLGEIKENSQVLYLGGGTGANLIPLLDRIGEEGKIFYIEASSKMIKGAELKIPASLKRRVIFLHQSDFKEIPHIEFDWLITQYFLDILPDEEIHILFQALSVRSGKNTQWIFVDFFEGQGKDWLVRIMIWFFQAFTDNPRKNLPDYYCFFNKYGWGTKVK